MAVAVEPVTQEAVVRLSPSELQQSIAALSARATSWFISANDAGVLSRALLALEQTGMDSCTALQELRRVAEEAATLAQSGVTVTRRDHQGGGAARALYELGRVIDGKESSGEKSERTLFLLHGATSHRAVADFATGIPPVIDETAQGLPEMRLRDVVLPDGSINPQRLREIAELRDIAMRYLEGNGGNELDIIDNFYTYLYEIFGEKARYLYYELKGPVARHLLLPTFMNWATAVLTFHNDRRVWFTEIDALRERNFLGGRIDALEVAYINGQKPSARQKEVLRELMLSGETYTTVPVLLQKMTRALEEAGWPKAEIQLMIVEHKFDVGDNKPKQDKFIEFETLDDTSVPIDSHQVQSYLTLANLADALTNDLSYDPKQGWPQNCRIIAGQIYYWLHTFGIPIVYDVYQTSSEQAEFFWKFIVSQHNYGREVATNRAITYAITRYLEGILNGKNSNGNGHRRRNGTQSVLLGKGIAEAIAAFRRYDPQYPFIERRWHAARGEEVQVLDLEAFRKLLVAAKIIKPNVPLQSGMYPCPQHNLGSLQAGRYTGTPSFEIDLETGTFHCWGKCGADIHHARALAAKAAKGQEVHVIDISRGFLDMGDTPRQARTKRVRHSGSGKGELLTIDDIVIPEATTRLLADAQVIMRDLFEKSRAAQEYVQGRGITLDMARTMGIGYCNGPAMQRRLLRQGYTLRQITDAGLRVEGRHRQYFQLHGMVTFPLAFQHGAPTGIYGRNIQKTGRNTSPDELRRLRRRAHRKLDVVDDQGRRVHHGIFNAQALYAGYDHLIVTEGIFDALSLIAMGYPNVVALVGAQNYLLVDLVSRHTKDIRLALDNDVTGEKRTMDIQAFLASRGYNGRVTNFTRGVYAQLVHHADPEVRRAVAGRSGSAKDWNALWVRFGPRLFRGK